MTRNLKLHMSSKICIVYRSVTLTSIMLFFIFKVRVEDVCDISDYPVERSLLL